MTTQPETRLVCGDALEWLHSLRTGSIQCCVTSPPYYGLRDYGVAGQMGLEATVEAFVANIVRVGRGIHRVLRDDGTFWLNLGDCWTRDAGKCFRGYGKHVGGQTSADAPSIFGRGPRPSGDLKAKDLIGVPWECALALRRDGWYLRQDIVWEKPNVIPSSVKDRPTLAHEYIFLLTKKERYFYDHEAVKEERKDLRRDRPGKLAMRARRNGQVARGTLKQDAVPGPAARTYSGFNARWNATESSTRRNLRSVWSIPVVAYRGAHCATFPPELARRAILAGSAPGDWVLDPFAGSGTTGLVAKQLGRHFFGIDLNPESVEEARVRIG